MQAHVVRNGLQVAGLKSSGVDEVRVEGLCRDEVLDDIVLFRGQHAGDIVDVDLADRKSVV